MSFIDEFIAKQIMHRLQSKSCGWANDSLVGPVIGVTQCIRHSAITCNANYDRFVSEAECDKIMQLLAS